MIHCEFFVNNMPTVLTMNVIFYIFNLTLQFTAVSDMNAHNCITITF